jgi:hypothetical protein
MRIKTIWLVCAIAICAACGGGGGGDDGGGTTSGGTGGTGGGGTGGGTGGGGGTVLTPDQTFAQNTAIAVTETTKQVVASDQSVFMPLGAVVENPSIVGLIRDVVLNNAPLPESGRELPVSVIESTTSDFSVDGDCGGTYSGTSTVTSDTEDPLFIFDTDLEGTFVNFCIEVPPYSVTYNGDVALVASNFSATSQEFTITLDVTFTSTLPDAPVTGSIDVAQSCTVDGAVSECTYATTFLGEASVYTVTGVQVFGDSGVGFDVSGDIADDDGNEYTFVASQITFCLSGNIQSGTIDVTVNGGDVVNISYPNCNEMIITYKGESRTVSQDL